MTAPKAIDTDQPGAAEPGGARHAALLLHAMAPADRDWTLASLPASQRAELQDLLQELQGLGIPSDPALVTELTRRAPQRAAPVVPATDEEQLHALAGHEQDALVQQLRSEPARLIADLLRVADWPWREALLDALEPGLRRRVDSALAEKAGMPVPPALRAALIAAVMRQLRERTAVAAVAGRWPWQVPVLRQSFHRFLSRADAWRRAVR